MSVPRFFLPAVSIDGSALPLPDEEAHHLVRVLRLAAGADVIVFDGAGREWDARVATAGRRAASVTLVAPRTAAPEPGVAVTLGIGVLKGDQMDAAIRDATALGVRAIMPIAASHVAVPARAWRSDAMRARWRRVAIAAAKQSGRAVVPDVLAPVSFDSAVDAGGSALLIALEPGRDQAGVPFSPGPRPTTARVLVGPEGGWAVDEVRRAEAAGARVLSVGPLTLRAALVPAVLLSSLWVAWGRD